MRSFLITFFISITSALAFSQNLVKNGSFEIINTACINHRTYSNSTPSYPILKDIYAIIGTPDLLNECADKNIYQSVNIPYSWMGYQWARTGTRMMDSWVMFSQINLNKPAGEEIISLSIKDTLVTNKKYLLKLYIVRSNLINYSTDIIDAGFSSDSVAYDSDGLITTTPDSVNYYYMVTNRGKGFLDDTLNWMEFSDTITANGLEKFIHIGKIKKANASNIKFINIHSSFPGNTSLLYFFDDVSLTPLDTIPPKSNAGNDTIICLGDSVLIGGHNYPDYFYTWWNNDSIIQRDKHKGKIWVQPDKNSWYYCRATDFRFDKSVDSVYVQVYPCKAANNDTTICKGDFINLANENSFFNNFHWSPDYYIDDVYSSSPIANPPNSVTYYASYSDSIGRNLKDSIRITVENCDSVPALIIPNVITPNGDGYNDIFKFKNQEHWNFQIIIYNRWGNELFNQTNINWDAKYNGKTVSPGVYYYIINAKAAKTGELRLFRGSVRVLY